MSIFAIGDLHLPGGDKKPMDVFGSHWEHHFERICADWRSRVKSEDIVLIPGDISWAMQLGDALSGLVESFSFTSLGDAAGRCALRFARNRKDAGAYPAFEGKSRFLVVFA